VAVFYKQKECEHLTAAIRIELRARIPTIDRVHDDDGGALATLQDTLSSLRICGGVCASGALENLKDVDATYNPKKPLARKWFVDVLYRGGCTGICKPLAKYCPSCANLRDRLTRHASYLKQSTNKRIGRFPPEEFLQQQVCHCVLYVVASTRFDCASRSPVHSCVGILSGHVFFYCRRSFERRGTGRGS
jgi:hypothetical protein